MALSIQQLTNNTVKMNLLENKIALITGAARGIGRRTAELFAEEGATVIVTDLKETESSIELMKKLKDINPNCAFYTCARCSTTARLSSPT